MSYYDPLIAKWATLTPGTTQQKLAQLNALTVQTLSQGKALLNPSDIINAIVPADLAALTQLQVLILTLLLSGSQIDASKGTTIRAAFQTLFAGKATTLANLLALVNGVDAPVTIPWWQATVAQGGGGLNSSVNSNDLAAAGGLS